MKTLIDMAREANDYATAALGVNAIPREWRSLRDKQFAVLVREEDAERIALLEQDNVNCRKAVSELMDDIQRQRAAMQAVFDKANAVEIDSDECLDFDECTAMLVPLDSYNGLIEAITALREALGISFGGSESSSGGMAQDHIRDATEMMQEPVAITDGMAYAFHHAITDGSLGADEVEVIKIGLREAFANTAPPTAPNLNCKSVQKRLATSWGYVKAQPQSGWVDLTDDEILTSANVSQDDIDDLDLSNVLSDVRAVIAKFKEKNTPPVVPQGEPVGRIDSPVRPDSVSPPLYRAEVTLTRKLDQFTDLYTTPPSVEAAGMAQEPVSHVWDGVGERCIVCGDKDWMASQYCPGKRIAPPTAALAARQMRDAAVKVCHDLERKRWETLVNGGGIKGWSPNDVTDAIAALPIPGEEK